MIETLITIGNPAKLKPGSVVVRVDGLSQIEPRYVVEGWESPKAPLPGQSWGSGFLRMRGEDGSILRVGPRSAVTKAFRTVTPEPEPIPEFRGGPEDSIEFDAQDFHQGGLRVESAAKKKKTRKPFWWERD